MSTFAEFWSEHGLIQLSQYLNNKLLDRFPAQDIDANEELRMLPVVVG